MKRDLIVERIIRRAKKDEKKKRDFRYLQTMGFLIAKGFLRTNQNIRAFPNARIRIEDAIWAGMNIEPRILEVLPAAVVRLPAHFDFQRKKHRSMVPIIDALNGRRVEGPDFEGIPYRKLNAWTELRLKDARTKPMNEKRIVKTYRLKRETIFRIEKKAEELGVSDTEALELLVANNYFFPG